jgi:uncharacterized protein YjbI with pentapeptide repeats
LSSSNELTLTELQKEIYRREDDVVELNKGAGQNQPKIDEKNRKITADKKALDARLQSVTSSKSEFATLIAGDTGDPKNKKKLESWTKHYNAAKEELDKYQAVIVDHQKKQVLASQELEAQQQKAAKKVELSYQQQKEKTFKIATDLLGDQAGLKAILTPLAEPRKSAKGISASQKWETFKKGVGFAWDHSSVLREAVASKSFYQNEAAKIQAMLEGKAQYDPANPPFFIRLLKDPDTINMLSGNVQILNNLTKELTPFLTDIVLKELGKIDTIQKEYDAQKKDIDTLPTLYAQLELLQKAEKKNESKITDLEQKIQKLESLQASYERAVLLKALQGAGIDGEYIKDKLLPVVQEVVASVLTEPKMVLKVASLATNMVLTQDPEQKQALQGEILKTIDISVVTKNAKLSEFLLKEGPNIAKAAGVVIASSPKLKSTLDSFNVSGQLVQDGIPLALEFAGKILQNSEGVGTLYEALKPVILDNTPDKIAKATTLEEVDALDKAKTKMVISVAAKLPDILLQGDVLEVMKEELPRFLDEHKETLATLAETALPKVIEKMKSGAEELTAKCSDALDAKEVYAIIVVPFVPLLEGVDPKFYGQVVPLAIDLVRNTMRALSQDKIKAISDSLKVIMDKDAEITHKDKAQGELIKIVTNLLENEPMQEVLAKKLPALLRENSEVLQVIANNAATIPALEKFGLEKALLDATTSLVVDVASTGLAQLPKLIEMNKAFTEYTAPNVSEETRQQALNGIISRAGEVVSELSPILETALPKYLEDNREQLLAVTGKIIAQEGVKAQLEKAGISAELAMEMAGVALDTAPVLLPVVTKFASDLVRNTMGALSQDEIKAISDSLKVIMDKDAEITHKDKEQGELIKIVTNLLENEPMQEVLAKKLPALLRENREVLQVMANNVVKSPALAKYGLDKALVDATTSLVVGVASTGLAQLPKLMEINKAFTQYTAPGLPEGAKKQALSGIISSAKEVVSGLSPILETALPEYLSQNKERILAVTKNVIAQEGVKAQLDKAGVPAELAMEMAGVALDTVPALLPVVTKLANAVLADKQGVENIVIKVQDLVVLLDEEKTASSEKEKDKIKKEINAKGTVLANSVLDFINNPGVKGVIDQDIPKFLEDNAKQIGATLDKFLNNTVIGRNLKVEGERIVQVASRKVPGIVDIVTQYQKGKYFSVMSGVVGLLRDPEVKPLVGRVVAEGIRYVIQKSYTSYRTRRNKWSNNIAEINESISALLSVGQEQKKDLGDLLLNVVKEQELGKASKTMEYMFIDKDLKGIVFDNTNPVPLDNIVIKGFSFDKAVFKDRSFDNSEIIDCSFAKAQFKSKVSFDGATIDAESLKTLLPEIRKYNKKNKDNPITLDNVKIVGDISQISFKDIQMENPDLTGATLDKGKTFKTHLKDASLDNPKLPKSEELNAKAQEIGAEITVGKRAGTHAAAAIAKRQNSRAPSI